MPVTTRGKEKREIWAMRITESEKQQILERAQAADMSMTQYLIRAALGTLDVDPSDIQQRFELLEDRLERLERAQQLGGL